MDAAGGEGLVQSQGDAAGRRIAVTIEVDEHFLPIDPQLFAGGVEDADVCLVEHDQIDVADRQIRGIDDGPNRFVDNADRPLEDRPAVVDAADLTIGEFDRAPPANIRILDAACKR